MRRRYSTGFANTIGLGRLGSAWRSAKISVLAEMLDSVDPPAWPEPGDTVTAVSLWEPWASLMALGSKTIETRSWSTAHRGPLLICAAKRRDPRFLNSLLDDPRFRSALASLSPPFRSVEIDDLAFGQAVALVDLFDCRRVEEIRPTETERTFGNFSPGRFGWLTRSRRRLKPFPVVGKQGLFSVRLPEL